MDKYIIWLIVVVICLVIEAATMGLTTIWFAIGAFIAFLLSVIGVPFFIQIAAFIVISGYCLICIYPIVKRKLKYGKEKTNYETVIQKVGVVTEKIDNMKSIGQVKVEGQIWSARSIDNEVIDVGSYVIIETVQGVKLIVKQSK